VEFVELQWLLLALPVAFAFGWLASRFDLRQVRRDDRAAPRAYFTGLNLLLNEQQDQAIDAFIEAVQHDPETIDLHFALGNLFRRRGEFERAVRVHQHLLARADLPSAERDRARHALAEDYLKAGLFDRAEEAFGGLEGTPYANEAKRALLGLYERSRDWHRAAEVAGRLEHAGLGSFAVRIAHHHCELALDADRRDCPAEADAALRHAREAAPLAARPLVLTGERHAAAGRFAEALLAWNELLRHHPEHFLLVAERYAECALAAGTADAARRVVQTRYEAAPSMDLWRALARLGDPPALLAQLRVRPSLSAASQWLAQPRPDTDAEGIAAVRGALERAAAPLQRYRCASCGFEARHYYWQCPGCLAWDSYPPQRIEEQ
jgi:lipopolysaccharide biosynthesis regulator YciM